MKTRIQNRHGQTIVVLVENTQATSGLTFINHGLGGSKDQKHIQTFSQAFTDADFTTVRFDTTNTFGESDGAYEDATTTNYYQDLCDVIKWAQGQDWYQEPFVLCGHSLGAFTSAIYAEKHPQQVRALAPIGTVVSGKLSLETPRYQGNTILKDWKETGVLEKTSHSGRTKRLKWSHIEDRLRYDLLPEVKKLTMPVLLIVGDEDEPCPPQHQKILFNALPKPKELHIIKGAPHTFRDDKHLQETKQILDSWIESWK